MPKETTFYYPNGPFNDVLCETFGCGRKLTYREQLFGKKCINCSGENQIIMSIYLTTINMKKEELREKVIAIVSEMYEVPVENITDTSDLQGDIGMDSLDVVEFTMECEREFNVTIPDEELDGITTVGGIVNKLFALISAT